MVKHIDAFELRAVAAAVLAVAADAVLVAYHLLKFGAYCLKTMANEEILDHGEFWDA